MKESFAKGILQKRRVCIIFQRQEMVCLRNFAPAIPKLLRCLNPVGGGSSGSGDAQMPQPSLHPLKGPAQFSTNIFG